MAKLNYLTMYSVQCSIAFGLAIITWLLLMYAEAYAEYLLDVNNYIESSSLKYFFSQFTRVSVSSLHLMFFIPFLVIVTSRKVTWLRYTWLFIAIMITVLAVFSIGSGGDRKGCTACLGVAYFYLLVLPIPAIASVLYGLFRWIIPTKRVSQYC